MINVALVLLSSSAFARFSVPSLCAAATDGLPTPPYVAILSAFPAELAPFVEAAAVDDTVDADGHLYYTGKLEGMSVLLGLTGIGMLNAESTAENLLDHFDVAGVVMSGVAGSHYHIGDVVVPEKWSRTDRKLRSRVNRALFALSQVGATALASPLEQCTPVPPTDPEGEIVCILFEPTVVFGRRGSSGDSFGDTPFPCTLDGGEIFGCELPAVQSASLELEGARSHAVPDIEDMETAAVARVARRHRVPFLGVRAVSDGAGDPLGDRGFPAQFFDYYRLAAHNEALLTRALVATLGALARSETSSRTCDLLAHRRWGRAAKLILAPLGQ